MSRIPTRALALITIVCAAALLLACAAEVPHAPALSKQVGTGNGLPDAARVVSHGAPAVPMLPQSGPAAAAPTAVVFLAVTAAVAVRATRVPAGTPLFAPPLRI